MKTIAQQLNIKDFPFTIQDKNGNLIYFEDSDGDWFKRECDSGGNETRFEHSDGYSYKREYDEKGNEIYFESSTGVIIDSRPKKSCDGKIVEIDGKKYKLTEVK